MSLESVFTAQAVTKVYDLGEVRVHTLRGVIRRRDDGAAGAIGKQEIDAVEHIGRIGPRVGRLGAVSGF